MKLGLIADVQYCDCDNLWNYEHTKERFYRNSINHLDNSLNYFQSNNCNKILQIGDLIDGRCRTFKNLDNAIDLIVKRFQCSNLETFHVTGNHELYNFTRKELGDSFMGDSMKKYGTDETDLNYYKVNLSSNIILIVLDTYDISVLNRRQPSSTATENLAAETILKENNPNIDRNDPIGAKQAKYVAFNGAVGNRQLEWLEEQLAKFDSPNSIVIVAGHIPLLGHSRNSLCLIWNDKEVIEILNKFKCVKAYICGHEHFFSVKKTKQFVQICMPGIIEAQPNETPYAILKIDQNKLTLSEMTGACSEMTFEFK